MQCLFRLALFILIYRHALSRICLSLFTLHFVPAESAASSDDSTALEECSTLERLFPYMF
jgi:hypothetical protein